MPRRRPRSHHHRAIDDAHGVITAVETTPGRIAENHKLTDRVAQHEQNTDQPLTQRRYHERRSTYEYTTAAGVCAETGDVAGGWNVWP